VVGGEDFAAGDILRHARLDPALEAALGEAGISIRVEDVASSRIELGRWLERMQSVTVVGLQVTRRFNACRRPVIGGFDTTSLSTLSVPILIVVVEELLKFGTPVTEALLGTSLRTGVTVGIDRHFVDPTKAAVVDTSPASITNGVAPTSFSGDAAIDTANLIRTYVAAGGKMESAVFILSSQNAIGMRLTGNDAFRELAADGGNISGVPTIASDSAADTVVIVDVARLIIAMDNDVRISFSRQGTVQRLGGSRWSGSSPASTSRPNG